MTITSPTAAVTPDEPDTDAPSLTLNGDLVLLGDVAPHTTLLSWLRDQGLTGSKEGCAEGECGACAVLVARAAADLEPGEPDDTHPAHPTEWVALNSCLVPVAALDGQEVVTVEGLGTPDHLHPVQRELAERGGSQCGYCTPGFVCSMAAEFYRPDREDFDVEAISGNLWRCTGYRPIVDAARALGRPGPTDPLSARRSAAPPSLRRTDIRHDGSRFVRPADLPDALALLREHPEALILGGSTDVGVAINLLGLRPGLVLAIDHLPELRGLHVGQTEIRVGAALTLTEVERGLAGRVPLLAELLPQFASPLIRNAATLGSNLATASPIGDAAPALLALEADVVLTGPDGDRTVPIDGFFTGYRQTVRQPDELIRELRIPLPLAPTVMFHKVAKRRFDDISSVAVAVALEVRDDVVTRVRIGLGGVAATPLRARATEAALEGMRWSPDTIERASAVLATEGTPISDQRASAAYRRAVLEQSLHRLYARTTESEAMR